MGILPGDEYYFDYYDEYSDGEMQKPKPQLRETGLRF